MAFTSLNEAIEFLGSRSAPDYRGEGPQPNAYTASNPAAVIAMANIIAAAEKATGEKVGITSGYRNYNVQAQLWANAY